jgi:tungstate transport system ATP-binding protein
VKPTVELRGVTRRYKEVVAVRDASLTAMPGEVLGIVGPSGAGKSTLLRLVDLLEPPDKGDLLIEGEAVKFDSSKAAEIRRRIGMVLQRPVALNRSVRNNLAYALRIRGVEEEEIYRKVDQELKRLGLADRSLKNAKILSGGEMQRLCFARATISDPDILLLDEFAANLDPSNVSLLENQLKSFVADGKNKTVVIVTHNLFQARRLCDKVALMWDGRVVEVAGKDKFFQHPDDARTAEFVKGEVVY